MTYRKNHNMSMNISYNIIMFCNKTQHNFKLIDEFLNYGLKCCFVKSMDEFSDLISQYEFDLIIVDCDNISYPLDTLFQEMRDISDMKLVKYISSTLNIDQKLILKYKILDYFIKEKNLNRTASQIKILLDRINDNISTSILIIDDSKNLSIPLKNILQVRNHKVYSADSSAKGLDLINYYSFDLIIININDPKINGTSILEYIRQEFDNNMIPVLILDEHVNQNKHNYLYKLGASYIHNRLSSFEALIMNIDYWIDYRRNIKNLIHSQYLLKEYKETVDISNIVSKTDKRGKIIYVNDQFCKISGYSAQELIGKPHNIIRHPDTPKDTFKEMWKTIKSKKVWKGKIKNLTKDGKPYYVDTTIKPLLDKDGNILEYISVRKNVTEFENLKQELQSELSIQKDCLSEIVKRSREYHRAMDESTMLVRTNLNGKITYINDQFINILGYEKSEIIGKDHRIMKHPQTPKIIIKNLWDTITSGKTWKGMIQNLNKNGDTVWLDTVIVPIKDTQEKVVEYLTIRNNVSEIIHLHEEIQTTQGELIYTLGAAAETRSKETGNHIKRVAHYSKLLALLIGMDSQEAEILFQASPMHDIGKLGIPDEILNKSSKLSDDEWEIMKTHSELGYQILNGSTRPILKAAAIVAYEHHERFDGKGYPNGLKGEDIHIYGRITALADVFDALGSDRCYKKAWNDEEIFKLFQNERGKHFDPLLIDMFFEHLDDFLTIRNSYKG